MVAHNKNLAKKGLTEPLLAKKFIAQTEPRILLTLEALGGIKIGKPQIS